LRKCRCAWSTPALPCPALPWPALRLPALPAPCALLSFLLCLWVFCIAWFLSLVLLCFFLSAHISSSFPFCYCSLTDCIHVYLTVLLCPRSRHPMVSSSWQVHLRVFDEAQAMLKEEKSSDGLTGHDRYTIFRRIRERLAAQERRLATARQR
jgi:hypothetical protein